MVSSSRTPYPAEKKHHFVCLQESHRHSNPLTAYLFPFALGLVLGGILMFLAYLECWVALWACQEREVQVLVQVAPAAPRFYIPHETQVQQVEREEGEEREEGQQSQSGISRYTKPEPRIIPVVPDSCPDRPLHLAILVLSAPSASLRRTAIRGTWVHDYRNRFVKVTTKFLVGTLELESQKLSSIKKEEEMFGDILILKDLKDSYANLSAKVLLGLKWANENLEFDYLVKVDDDSYVRVEGISDSLRKLNCDQRLYWGYFMGHAYPEPKGKWAEHKWFICPHYLPYAMGGGYVLSRQTVRLLMLVSDRLILYNNEDVTVGSWLAPYRLNRKHDIRFNVESLSHGCNNGYLISHKERVRTFYMKYTNLIRNGTLCGEEKETHPAYIYNWTGSPMNCCERIRGIPVI